MAKKIYPDDNYDVRNDMSTEVKFQKIYDRYHLKVYNYIAKCIGSREEATDLLQEVFLLFYHKLPDLDVSTGKIEAWLLRVARNFSMSYSRTRTKQPITGISHFEPASMVNTEQDLQKKELHQKLDEFLDSLNETERSIFILHKIEGMKYKDLMKVFDISHRTLKRVVRSVLIKLKDRKLFDEEDF